MPVDPFQEPADDAGHADVVAETRQARPEAADAPDDHINLDARLGRLVEAADQPVIDQRIHLKNQAPLAAGARVLALPLDQVVKHEGSGIECRHPGRIKGPRNRAGL